MWILIISHQLPLDSGHTFIIGTYFVWSRRTCGPPAIKIMLFSAVSFHKIVVFTNRHVVLSRNATFDLMRKRYFGVIVFIKLITIPTRGRQNILITGMRDSFTASFKITRVRSFDNLFFVSLFRVNIMKPIYQTLFDQK